MVVILLKVTEKNQFLYETNTSVKIEKLMEELVLGKSILFYFS